MMMEAMGAVRAHVEANFDYVGDSFATEARAIHEGKSEERSIYGEATPVQARALIADGTKHYPSNAGWADLSARALRSAPRRRHGPMTGSTRRRPCPRAPPGHRT